MEIALKNNEFDDTDVKINITPYTRDKLANTMKFMAVTPTFSASPNTYDMDIEIIKYLNDHPDTIVAVPSGRITNYYMHKTRLRPKHIPSMRIQDVDTTQPWTILNENGYEMVAYIKDMPNNQKILEIAYN